MVFGNGLQSCDASGKALMAGKFNNRAMVDLPETCLYSLRFSSSDDQKNVGSGSSGDTRNCFVK